MRSVPAVKETMTTKRMMPAIAEEGPSMTVAEAPKIKKRTAKRVRLTLLKEQPIAGPSGEQEESREKESKKREKRLQSVSEPQDVL